MPTAEYKLEENEAQHLRRLTSSRNITRLRLLEAKEQLDAIKAVLEQTQTEAAHQEVQLASAVAMLAANRGEEEFQGWAASPDCSSIVRRGANG